MFERFTESAREVVVYAQDEARALRHSYIGSEHLLLGLLREHDALAARVLESLDMTVEEVRAQIARIVGQGEEVTTGQIPFTPRAQKVLELSLREALALGHNYLVTEHLLLGLVRDNEGVAVQILLDFDADPERIRDELIRELSGAPERARPAGSQPSLNLPDLLEALERAKNDLIDRHKFEQAASLRDKQRKLSHAMTEAQAALQKLELAGPPPSATGADAARWQYRAETLEGATETWPDQLTRWRQDGWELLAVITEGERHRALLERRV